MRTVHGNCFSPVFLGTPNIAAVDEHLWVNYQRLGLVVRANTEPIRICDQGMVRLKRISRGYLDAPPFDLLVSIRLFVPKAARRSGYLKLPCVIESNRRSSSVAPT